MRFKGVASNSTIREIGHLFRRLDNADWRIHVGLKPSKAKRDFSVSQLPVLARRRVLNSAEEKSPAGYPTLVDIKRTANWTEGPIASCPIHAVREQNDKDQWCFVFEHNGITHYLPQIELARVLFIHNAYLARLSLVSGGLSQEFDVQWATDAREAQVNILPTCSLPLYAREGPAHRRTLAWILLDPDARQSFDSIATNQLNEGYEKNNYRLWRFRFSPPPLKGVRLTMRGHFAKDVGVCFVYEIHGIAGLSWHGPSNVTFFDPRYHEGHPGENRGVRPAASFVPEPEIDDEEVPTPDSATTRIEIPPVKIHFVNPFSTSRTGCSSGPAGGRSRQKDAATPPENAFVEVGTDEASVLGTVPAADYDGLEDQSDDAHLYAKKFEAFKLMAAQLVNMPDCLSVAQGIRKLPPVKGRSKHRLTDGNPRCTAFHIVTKNGTAYALLEVDVSDSKDALSTLLLKEPRPSFDWDGHLMKLEKELVKKSLVWPTEFLNEVFQSDYRRIAHPTTSSKSAALLKSDSIHNWTKRVYSQMQKL